MTYEKRKLLNELMAMERNDPTTQIKNPDDAITPLMRKYATKRQEHFAVMTLDGNHQIIKIHTITKGTANHTFIHPRDVYRTAIIDNAVAIIIAHNHPSGNTNPSLEDKKLTIRIKDAGSLLNIPVLDHIIVSTKDYYSFLENREL